MAAQGLITPSPPPMDDLEVPVGTPPADPPAEIAPEAPPAREPTAPAVEPGGDLPPPVEGCAAAEAGLRSDPGALRDEHRALQSRHEVLCQQYAGNLEEHGLLRVNHATQGRLLGEMAADLVKAREHISRSAATAAASALLQAEQAAHIADLQAKLVTSRRAAEKYATDLATSLSRLAAVRTALDAPVLAGPQPGARSPAALLPPPAQLGTGPPAPARRGESPPAPASRAPAAPRAPSGNLRGQDACAQARRPAQSLAEAPRREVREEPPAPPRASAPRRRIRIKAKPASRAESPATARVPRGPGPSADSDAAESGSDAEWAAVGASAGEGSYAANASESGDPDTDSDGSDQADSHLYPEKDKGRRHPLTNAHLGPHTSLPRLPPGQRHPPGTIRYVYKRTKAAGGYLYLVGWAGYGKRRHLTWEPLHEIVRSSSLHAFIRRGHITLYDLAPPDSEIGRRAMLGDEGVIHRRNMPPAWMVTPGGTAADASLSEQEDGPWAPAGRRRASNPAVKRRAAGLRDRAAKRVCLASASEPDEGPAAPASRPSDPTPVVIRPVPGAAPAPVPTAADLAYKAAYNLLQERGQDHALLASACAVARQAHEHLLARVPPSTTAELLDSADTVAAAVRLADQAAVREGVAKTDARALFKLTRAGLARAAKAAAAGPVDPPNA